MEKLQNHVLDISKKLARYTNIISEIFSLVISEIIVFVLFRISGLQFDIITQIVLMVLVFIYFVLRRFIALRHNVMRLDYLYATLKAIKKNVEFYMPIFEVDYKGFRVKNAIVYIYKNEMYLEAFDSKKRKEKYAKSVSLKFGKDIQIYEAEKVPNRPFILYKAKLMLEDYKFFVPENKEIMELIQKYNNKEKEG